MGATGSPIIDRFLRAINRLSARDVLNVGTITGNRTPLTYNGAQSVTFHAPFIPMGGFRFRGGFTRFAGVSLAKPNSNVASLTTELTVCSTRASNWYAVFGVANEGATQASLRIMPFFRAGTVSGSNVPLVEAGERKPSPASASYTGMTDQLNGADVLVISENGYWSGRVTTITDCTESQVTLQTIGSIAANDWLLPAPIGFDHYGYIGSFYRDTAEVRNIADDGINVMSKGTYLDYAAQESGQIASPTLFKTYGHICPLATNVIMDVETQLNTASTGLYAQYFAIDGSAHTIRTTTTNKALSTNETDYQAGVTIPFYRPQEFYYSNAGALAPNRSSGRFHITGWVEP